MSKQYKARRKKALRFWRAYADRPYLPVPEGVWYRVQDYGSRQYDERLMYGHRPWRQ